MSWETLIIGSFKFIDSISEEERKTLIDRIKDVLELPANIQSVTYGAFNERYENKTYYFCHVNWLSHVDEEKIENLIREIGSKIKGYDITLYYLGEGISFFRDPESGENAISEVS
jgi:YHS domain-containing protein